MAVLVVVAVVAGIGVAAYGFATRGSGKSAPVLQIDEVNGRVGPVALGETPQNVKGVLGPPETHGPADFLIYPHMAIGLRNGRVVSIETEDSNARTKKFVHMADPFSAVRASYRKAARCIPNRPDKEDPHPRCTVTVPAGVLYITGDPIRAITLRTS